MQQTKNTTVESPVSTESKSIQDYVGSDVYTSQGIYVGSVEEVMLELDEEEVSGLGLVNCNPDLFQNSSANVGPVQIPFSWVLDANDIIVVRSLTTESLRL